MRTKQLNINGTKELGVLLCGGPHFKVYSIKTGIAVLIDKKIHTFTDKDASYTPIMRYVNFRWEPFEKHNEIISDFDALIRNLKGDNS